MSHSEFFPSAFSLQPTAYLHDGYTCAGYVQERRHLHPAVRFTYRPMLRQNRSVVFKRIRDDSDPKALDVVYARTIAGQIVEWDLTMPDGAPVPLTAEHILRLEPNLFDKLFNIVTGISVTDEDPRWSEDQRSDFDAELDAALAGTDLLEDAAKN